MFHLMPCLMSDMVYTRRQKPIGLAQKYTEYNITNFLKNNLSFSLYAVLSICCIIGTLENGLKSKEDKC